MNDTTHDKLTQKVTMLSSETHILDNDGDDNVFEVDNKERSERESSGKTYTSVANVMTVNDILLTNDNKTHRGSLTNSKKWDKFNSHLKRAFPTEYNCTLGGRPHKTPRGENSNHTGVLWSTSKNTKEKETKSSDTSDKLMDNHTVASRAVNVRKSSSSFSSGSTSRTPSPHEHFVQTATTALSPRDPTIMSSKHHHYHHKKAAAAAALAEENRSGNDCSTGHNIRRNSKDSVGEARVGKDHEKGKKNSTSGSSSPSPTPSHHSPSKTHSSNKKKHKSKYCTSIYKNAQHNSPQTQSI